MADVNFEKTFRLSWALGHGKDSSAGSDLPAVLATGNRLATLRPPLLHEFESGFSQVLIPIMKKRLAKFLNIDLFSARDWARKPNPWVQEHLIRLIDYRLIAQLPRWRRNLLLNS